MADADPIQRLNAALDGCYRIKRELGAGGMATVYLAEDVRHHRSVALKVLKPELAAVVGSDRFLTEIETTARLQHPHILPLYDSGEADGFLFYVMPYVEGDSLRDRIDREKQLPVDEAVRIATDVAEGLDHAHRQGVVHRDVKPANILLQDGRPVVADFGIALAVQQAGGGRLTEKGVSLGTPYYMSPEQAAGDRDVDARSDVYALGCVMYEMLTGEPPYTGSTAQAVLGRILMGQVDRPSIHRKSIPPNVDGAVLKALEKLPADRFNAAAGFADALQNPAFRHSTGEKNEPGSAAALRGGRLGAVGLVAVLAAILAGAGGWLAGRGAVEPPEVERHRIVLGSGPERIPDFVALRTALHPEGKGILFADTSHADGVVTIRSWWKGRGQVDATRLASMDGAVTPTFSPDGEWVAFVKDGQLFKQPLTGGTSVTLANDVSGGTAQALAWLDDGTIVFETRGYVLQRISDTGQGPAETVSTEDRTGRPIHMTGLPDGWGVLVSASVGGPDANVAPRRLFLLDLVADTVAPLAEEVVRAWPAPDGRIVYLTRAGGVFAAELDRESLSLEAPVPLFEGVRVPLNGGEMHVAADGTAVYVRGEAAAGAYELNRVDRTGRAMRVGAEHNLERFTTLALSSDGSRLAAGIGGPGGVQQLWVKDMPDGPLVPLTLNQASAARPTWHPDDSRIAYVSGVGHLLSVRADGAGGEPDTLYSGSEGVYQVEFTPGGDTVIGHTGRPRVDLVLLDPDAGSAEEPRRLTDTPQNEFAVDLSPDGRWLAHVSDVSGRYEVYVRPFPDISAGRFPVSLSGGTEPVWAHSADEIFYRDAGGWLVAARVATDPAFRVVSRERLFDASGFGIDFRSRAYDVFPDDQTFVMLAPGPGEVAEGDDLVLVENFFQELEARWRR